MGCWCWVQTQLLGLEPPWGHLVPGDFPGLDVGHDPVVVPEPGDYGIIGPTSQTGKETRVTNGPFRVRLINRVGNFHCNVASPVCRVPRFHHNVRFSEALAVSLWNFTDVQSADHLADLFAVQSPGPVQSKLFGDVTYSVSSRVYSVRPPDRTKAVSNAFNIALQDLNVVSEDMNVVFEDPNVVFKDSNVALEGRHVGFQSAKALVGRGGELGELLGQLDEFAGEEPYPQCLEPLRVLVQQLDQVFYVVDSGRVLSTDNYIPWRRLFTGHVYHARH